MPDTYPRTICLRLIVASDGKVEMRKVWEENATGQVIKENGQQEALPSNLNTTLRGHNSIGVLVSNPTCFIVGGVKICI